MKKILGIVGSPRENGNTHILVKRLLEGARESGAETDIVMLGPLHIRECDGCHVCWKNKPCPKNDDMLNIYTLIAESDAVVFGTPVYWFGPTALMKAMIDRFVYFNSPENRNMVAGKDTAVVVPLEETDPETWAPVVHFFEKSLGYMGMRIAGTVIAPGVDRKGDVLAHPDILAEAFEMGKRLASKTG